MQVRVPSKEAAEFACNALRDFKTIHEGKQDLIEIVSDWEEMLGITDEVKEVLRGDIPSDMSGPVMLGIVLAQLMNGYDEVSV